MKSLKSIIIGFTIIILVLASCKKTKPDEHNHQETNVMITIDSPTESQQFDNGSIVNIIGKIEASEELHGYKIIVRQVSDNSIKFEAEKHTHGITVNFNENWINTVTGMQNMELEVIAVIDHDGNTANKKVNFYCHDN